MCHVTQAAHQCLGFWWSVDVIHVGPADTRIVQARFSQWLEVEDLGARVLDAGLAGRAQKARQWTLLGK